jgi:hypothetical protein
MAMRRFRVIAAALALGLLGACGNVGDGLAVVQARIGSLISTRQMDTSAGLNLPRETIDEAAVPLILVEVPNRDASATMLSIGRNRTVTSWAGRDDVGLSMAEPGLVISTRGYGGDILSADIRQVLPALRQPSGAAATRTFRFLDGTDQEYARSYFCEFERVGEQRIEIVEETHQTVHVTERCEATDHGFENHYWIDANGLIWRSVQFAGSYIGYLNVERLHR